MVDEVNTSIAPKSMIRIVHQLMLTKQYFFLQIAPMASFGASQEVPRGVVLLAFQVYLDAVLAHFFLAYLSL